MISLEKGQKKDEIFAMWQRNFHDPVPYAKFYFDEVYGKNEILINEQDGDCIKGMLHLNPYGLRMEGETVAAHYIVGVATDEEYRRQGVMRELLEDTFSRLRERGEFLTYLMPADENYYLPFDFRFGSCQIEQEIECFSAVMTPETQENWEFVSLAKENLSELSLTENQKKDDIFAIHTEITPEYLIRLEKETNSDFGKLLLVYHNGMYAGRFVVGAENDYMVVSQIFCKDDDSRELFLYQILKYCEESYHYGKYQLILDESWKDNLKKAGNYCGVRVLPLRSRPIIMFRILNLEQMGKYLISKGEEHGFLKITDSYVKEQEGIYEWTLSKEGCVVQKMTDQDIETDCGEISVGDLTAFLFGDKKGEGLNLTTGLTTRGKELLSVIETVQFNCIQEIV